MLQDIISKIEEKIQDSSAIKSENRAELLTLMETLRSEITELSKTHREQAQSIAGFTEVSAHEATRKEPKPELIDLSVKGLSSSVEDLEESHPQLVAIVNRICTILSNMGI